MNSVHYCWNAVGRCLSFNKAVSYVSATLLPGLYGKVADAWAEKYNRMIHFMEFHNSHLGFSDDPVIEEQREFVRRAAVGADVIGLITTAGGGAILAIQATDRNGIGLHYVTYIAITGICVGGVCKIISNVVLTRFFRICERRCEESSRHGRIPIELLRMQRQNTLQEPLIYCEEEL